MRQKQRPEGAAGWIEPGATLQDGQGQGTTRDKAAC